MRLGQMLRQSGYRERQTKQFNQACLKPGVPAAVLAGPKFEILTEHKGKKIIITDHAREQARKRQDFINIEQMKKYFVLLAEGLDEYTWKEYNQEVFVYSKSYRRGCIIAHRRDHKNHADVRMHYCIVTVYPFGVSKPAKADTEVIYAD